MSTEDGSGEPTMRDVAAYAGVSLGTVHNVLRPGSRHVNDARREKVMAAVAALGYRPTPKRRRTSSIPEVGVVLPSLTNYFFGSCLEGIAAVLDGRTCLMICAATGEDPAVEERVIASLLKRRIDGLLLTPCGEVPEAVVAAERDGLPVVLMDRCPPEAGVNRVVLDIYESSFLATRILLDSGHTRLALINGPEDMFTSLERRRGFTDALQLGGAGTSGCERVGPWTFEHGREAMAELLALPEPPQAVFSSSPMLTMGVLAALRERNLSWPDEVAVVGYGDPPWASLVDPPLTSVDQPLRQMGETSATLLLAAMRHGPSSTGRSVTMRSHVVMRDSHWARSLAVNPEDRHLGRDADHGDVEFSRT